MAGRQPDNEEEKKGMSNGTSFDLWVADGVRCSR